MLQKYINAAAAIKDGDPTVKTAYWLGTLDGVVIVAIIAAIVWALL